MDDGGQGDSAALAAKIQLDVECAATASCVSSSIERSVNASLEGGCMSNMKTGSAASASRAPQPTETNLLDFVPDEIPFDIPYGAPISLERAQAAIGAAVAEAKKRSWKMNVAVADSGGNLVAFQRMDGAM